ncbi:nuclear receptor subfamily 1 group I member 2 isoform X2 [Hyla sarda]|uniref:nuclear receptor subfamily 1 group I member 2 isoform X2 n=1 Tax=Hyla sarda TaxID=327740 RepID=UPI0024C3B4BA|nr:nuclear receptor subfamily 1 group I member 2 isoform X2 [Hyla sarda]
MPGSSCTRRAMKRHLQLSCPFQNACVINKSNRRHCQACRLKKCLDIGMKKELIMSDEAVEQRRSLIKKKQRLSQIPPLPPVSGLTGEQEKVVQQVTEAQKKTFDSSFTYFRNYRPVRRHPHPEDQLHQPAVFLMLPHISDLTTYVIKGIINFAKVIPYFRDLGIEDQIALLKGCALELTVIRFNTVFDNRTQSWLCGQYNYNVDDLTMAGFRQLFLEPLVRFHCMLKKLCLHIEEYALMQAISLFSADRPGVRDHRRIDEIQEHLALTLMAYIESQRPPSLENRFRFAKIMECLTELRTMNDEHSKQLLRIWDIQPDYTPLMHEGILMRLPQDNHPCHPPMPLPCIPVLGSEFPPCAAL